MALSDLIVLNRRGTAAQGATHGAGPLSSACGISTCLREVRVAALPGELHPSASACAADGFERFRGAEAYRFLLLLACGLESEIAGETEILGQIKDAWREHERADAQSAPALRPWMQRLLQDTKEIRSEFVNGLGSATYGSLVRRLLGADSTGPTLLLGAGQLAESVLPYLDSGKVLLWNRHGDRARELLARQRGGAQHVQAIDSTVDAELAAWKEARNVVICIPADPRRDVLRAHAWRQHRTAGGGRVLHLGLESAAGTAWEGVANLSTLRDLFALRDTQASQRDALLARARRACADKAQLARLDDADGSKPGTANHGWEDLAVFQSFSY
jgi:Glutamyl-tRNAGlu reductase, N-terminal domain